MFRKQPNPYDKDAYAWMLDQYGDQNDELTNFASVFGLESAVEAYKMTRLEAHAKKLYNSKADFKDSCDALEQMTIQRESLNYQGEPGTYEQRLLNQNKELLEEEKKREVEKRTVNDTVYETIEQAEQARSNIAYASAVLEQMENLSYSDLCRERQKLEQMNQAPENSIQHELLQFIAFFSPIDEKERTFQGTVYESFEERQRAEKEFAILMGDIDPASVTAEQLQEAKKRFDEHTEFGSAVRKKAGEILIECGQKLLGLRLMTIS